MNRAIAFSVLAVLAGGLGYWVHRIKGPPPDNSALCAVQLRNVEETNAAMQDGYEVDLSRRCITRRSYEQVARERQRLEEMRVAARTAPQTQASGEAAVGPQSLAEARTTSIVPHRLSSRSDMEGRLRSPIYWLGGITTPTYVVEGTGAPSNIESLEELCKTGVPQLQCIRVPRANHFSVVSRVTKVVAARLAVPKEGAAWIIRPEDFQ